MRRAQALLGTLVSVEVDRVDLASAMAAEAAIAAALARVAAIHRAMSFHEPTSALRALARARAGDVVAVGADTHAVLALALRLERESARAFNACCAAALVERGLLPRPDDAQPSAAICLEDGVELLADGRVRVRATPWIDLGGIAKGYAVDAAVAALAAAGPAAGFTGGIVNAGGDLRVFGARRLVVQVRDPAAPGRAPPVAEIAELACATSAWRLGGDTAEHLLATAGPANASAAASADSGDNAPASVTVFAPSCAVADALTKVVWQRGAASTGLLRAHRAEALVHHRDGRRSRL